MKIPRKYQVFDSTVVSVSSKDRERLSPHLVSSGRLNEMFLLGVNEPDLCRLVVLELMGNQRRDILSRLLSRILTIQRRRIQGRIEKCLQKKR